MGEQRVRWGGCPVSHPPLLWLIEVPICNSICLAARCQCVRGWGSGDVIGVTVRTAIGIFTSPTFVWVNEDQLAALWWGHPSKQQGVPYLFFTSNRGMRTRIGCCDRSLINILLLHNTCLRRAANYLDFSLYLTFLSYLLKRKTCLLMGDMPALISECDSANCILVHKQIDSILGADKLMTVNHTWKTPLARFN